MLLQYMPSSCVHVCPTQAVLYRNDWTNQAGFWHGGLLEPIPHCVIRKFGYLQQSGYFVPNSGLKKNFATASRSHWQQNLSTVEPVDDTTPIRQSTSRGCLLHCNPLTPLLRFVVDWICCTTCFYSWQDFDWHSKSCDSSVVAEILVKTSYDVPKIFVSFS